MNSPALRDAWLLRHAWIFLFMISVHFPEPTTAYTHPELAVRSGNATYNTSTSFPQIWVVDGLVECSQPLVPDPCSITSASLTTVTIISTDSSKTETVTSESTVLIGTPISSNTYTPFISFTTFNSNVTTTTTAVARHDVIVMTTRDSSESYFSISLPV